MIADHRTEFRDVPIEHVAPNRQQPRRVFDPEALEALAQSLRVSTLLQRVIVRPVGDVLELIAGERRWRAARLAGWKTIPAEIRHGIGEAEALALALVENELREDLPATALARGLQALVDGGKSQADVARMFGKSAAWVSNLVRLLKLPAEWQGEIDAGTLPQRNARLLIPHAERPDLLAAIAEARRSDPSQFADDSAFAASVDFLAQMFDEMEGKPPRTTSPADDVAAGADDAPRGDAMGQASPAAAIARHARPALQRRTAATVKAPAALASAPFDVEELLRPFVDSREALVAIRDHAEALLDELELG